MSLYDEWPRSIQEIVNDYGFASAYRFLETYGPEVSVSEMRQWVAHRESVRHWAALAEAAAWWRTAVASGVVRV